MSTSTLKQTTTKSDEEHIIEHAGGGFEGGAENGADQSLLGSTEQWSPKPTRNQVVNRIAKDLGMSKKKARTELSFIFKLLGKCRADNGFTLLTREDLEHHDTFVTIIPDRTVAEPGSLQADVERLVLMDDEVGIWHDIDLSKGVRHCAVTITTIDVNN